MQTLVANFVKNPASAPAPNWPKYVPGNATTTLAKLAYNANVELGNVVQAVQSNSMVRMHSLLLAAMLIFPQDGPCDTLWNEFLDVRL